MVTRQDTDMYIITVGNIQPIVESQVQDKCIKSKNAITSSEFEFKRKYQVRQSDVRSIGEIRSLGLPNQQ